MDERTIQPLKIGVLGPHECTADDLALGREVGREIARRGAILLCGGLDGMMEAAAQGAREAGGLTIGILPGENAADANPFICVALPTALGPYRNVLLARASDAVIAIRGGYGTLLEIAAALRWRVPVVGLQTWTLVQNERVDEGIHRASTPREAVEWALRLARESREKLRSR